MAVDNVSAILPQIAGAIRRAASTTGASFEYLLTTAQIESRLNPGAQAATSSAGRPARPSFIWRISSAPTAPAS